MKYAVIVDAYSTGARLADELKLRGFACIHVQTSAEILDYDVDSFQPDDFQHLFVATQDLKALTDALAVLSRPLSFRGVSLALNWRTSSAS